MTNLMTLIKALRIAYLGNARTVSALVETTHGTQEPTSNPLSTLIKTLGPRWYDPLDLAVIVGFQMKLANVDWRTNDQLAMILTVLHQINFIQGEKLDKRVRVRVNPIFF